MLKEWGQSIAEAAVILLLLFIFLWPLKVVGVSMKPTLDDGDRILISRFSAFADTYERGDMVVFDADNYTENMVKRVIALGGDTIKIDKGTVYVNDEPIEESYSIGLTEGEILLDIGQNEVFVMGDNREESIDSRDYGAIDKEDIFGKVLFRFFPFDELTLFD